MNSSSNTDSDIQQFLQNVLNSLQEVTATNKQLVSRMEALEATNKELVKTIKELKSSQRQLQKSIDGVNRLSMTPVPPTPIGESSLETPTVEDKEYLDSNGVSRPKPLSVASRNTWISFAMKSNFDVKSLSKNEVICQEAMYELIHTEQIYAQDLTVALNVYHKNLASAKVISDADLTLIFGNMTEICTASKVFYGVLGGLYTKENPVIKGIGEASEKNLAFLIPLCEKYCETHPKALQTLRSSISSNFKLKTLLDQIFNDSESHHQTLESYLIKPIQRFCKYPLLFRLILKNSSESPDMAALNKALSNVEQALERVNSKAKILDEKQKILLLMERIDSDVPISTPERLFKEGMVKIIQRDGKAQERYFALTNDRLLIGKAQGKNRFSLSQTIQAELLLIDDRCDDETQFTLIVVGREKMLIGCESPGERNQWLAAFDTQRLVKPICSPTIDITSADESEEGTPDMARDRYSRRRSISMSGVRPDLATLIPKQAQTVRSRQDIIEGRLKNRSQHIPRSITVEESFNTLEKINKVAKEV